MRKIAILLTLASTALATPALARDGAFYVGVEGGGMIVEDQDYDITNSIGQEFIDNIEVDHRLGFDVDGLVGYDFGVFRLEGEVGYKRAEITGIQQNLGQPLPIEGASRGGSVPTNPQGDNSNGNAPGVPFIWNGARGSTRVLSFMVNGLLDFGDDDGLQGYVGGGVGVARTRVDALRLTNAAPVYIDDSDSGFAWQVIAGFRFALTDNVDLGLKYRYFTHPDVELQTFYSSDASTRFRSHSVLASLIFNFGEPEAPPPPPPPPPRPLPPAPPLPPPPPPACEPGPFLVFFDWDRSDIRPDAASVLDNVASQYRTGRCPTQVMLAGHADRSGSVSYNVGLSQRRNDAVRGYLASRGIPDGSMSSEAFGEGRPLVATADGVREQQNRRVEIMYGPGSGF